LPLQQAIIEKRAKNDQFLEKKKYIACEKSQLIIAYSKSELSALSF
jgi:hypothetical protein